ncbi:PfkB family carbohydrate kinase [Spirochaeta dissipatitropha]
MKKIVTFGEIMLRLKSPGHERFFQSPALEATFGGGESNVAVSLSLLGMQAQFVTMVPANPIGEAAVREVQRYGVDVSAIARGGARLGTYYLETGANQRASNVVYDRAFSSISTAKMEDFNWKAVLDGAQWFHITGITPALSREAADLSLAAVKAAKEAGLSVSIDLNYRKKLWNYGASAPEIMSKLAAYADLIIANEEDIQKCLGIEAKDVDVSSGHLSTDSYKQLAGQVKETYPNISRIAITMRESLSADKNGWSAVLDTPEGFFISKKYHIDDIIDRVGGGDSFSAGIIYGVLNYPDNQQALEFAVAASALKHSIPGDFNLTSLDEVKNLMGGDGSGRVQR